MSQWLLPENVEDFLPRQAKQLEIYRRQLLDLYAKNGYELVMPSLLEYADSLNAFGRDLDLDTFKVVDQLSGRMMGVSSDLTTQTSRIDSQLMKESNLNKLCYAGPVLRTKTALTKSRELYQVGIEYFGNSDIAADIEVQTILINSLKLLNINNITLDTLNNTLSVRRESKKSYTVLNWDLTLTYINTHKGVGTTYNFQDDTTGGYGFLYVQDNGIIIFVSKSPMESDTYLGFLGFLDQK